MRAVPVVVLLAGPAALAFFTGGFTPTARTAAGLVVWLLAAVGIALHGMPRGRLAIGGLGGLAGWTVLSTVWAPVAGAAWDAGQVALLYLGALVAAATLLRPAAARRAALPGLALGTLVVVAYGLAERLLPGLLELARSTSAEGRLEQPLTYWNGMGVVAATGVVLCAGLVADATRDPRIRALAAAAGAPLGLGLALTVSRGALWAGVAGLLALVVLSRRREALLGSGLVVAAGLVPALAAQPFDGVTALAGAAGERETGGLVVLLVLLVAATAAGIAGWALALRPTRPLALPRGAGVVAATLVVAGFVLAVALGSDESRGGPGLDPGAQRLTTLDSNRYEYWKVAARAFGDAPVIGVGAEGWGVRWRMERPFAENARDAHSLPFQTAAELGLVGLALLAAWLAGVGRAAAAAVRRDRVASAGPIAGVVVWAAHTTLDWDFQLPATTLPAIVLMGWLLVQARAAPPAASASASVVPPASAPGATPTTWRSPLVALAGLVAVGAVLRWIVAGQSLFRDELSTAWLTSMGGPDMLRTIAERMEITPPLSFAATWVTSRIADGPHGLRLAELLASLVAIPLVHAIGTRTVGRGPALLAAAITALAPFAIFYGAEARAYGLLTAASALTVLAALLAADTGRRRWWVLYAVATAAVASTHYTGVFVLVVVHVWLLLAHPRARRPATLAVAAAVVLYLPWLLTGLGNDLASPDSAIASRFVDFTPGGVAQTLAHWVVGFPTTAVGLADVPGAPAAIALALAVVAALAALVARRPGRPSSRLWLVVAVALAAPVGETVASLVGPPAFTVNSLASSWPGLALALAALLLAAGPRLRLVTVGLALAAYAVAAVQVARPVNGRPDFERAAGIVAAAGAEAVVIDGSGSVFGTPGPLTPLDLGLERPARIVRIGIPQQRERQFVGGEGVVSPRQAVDAALALAGDAPIVAVSPAVPGRFLAGFEANLADAGLTRERRAARRVITEAALGDVLTVVYVPR